MKLRSKDIIAAIFASFGYRTEPIRTKNTSDTLASDPFVAQQGLIHKLGVLSPVVFDIGANQGETAAEYQKLFPDSTIHCFEPFPEMLEVLNDRFGQDNKIQIVPKAVSRETGSTTFYVNHAAATNSLLPGSESTGGFYPKEMRPKGEIEVDTISLDSYCNDHGIDRIHVLKLDIQGGELMALSGAQKMLSEQRVDLVYCEIQFVPLYKDAAQFDGVWAMLREQGFSLYDVYDLHRSAGGQLLYGDALFVSKACKESVVDRLRISK